MKGEAQQRVFTELAQVAFGDDITDDILKACLAAREEGMVSVPDVLDSPLFADDVVPAMLPEEMEEDENLQEAIQKIRADAEKAKELRDKKKDAAVRAVASGDSPSTAEPPPAPKAIAWPSRPFTRKEALKFLPPGVNLSREVKHHNRWRISSDLTGNRSKEFSRTDWESDHAALKCVLRIAWTAYTRRHKVECPFLLDDGI